MERVQLKIGDVHRSRDRHDVRQIVTIERADEAVWVTYHVIVAKLRNSDAYCRFKRLAPHPTKTEHEALTKVCAGVPIATCSEATFRRWSGGLVEFDRKFKEPGRSMADLCLERVLAKGMNGISFERALSFDAARCDFQLRHWGLPFVFTFLDGSRVAYTPALVFAEVDPTGRPLPGGRQCLERRWEYGGENTKRIIREDFERWLPHFARLLPPSAQLSR